MMRVIRFVAGRAGIIVLALMAGVLGAALSRMSDPRADAPPALPVTGSPEFSAPSTNTPRPSREPQRVAMLPTSTPAPSPTITLRPPPTFEPPTATPAPSSTPTITPTATLQGIVDVPGLHGLETPTPSSTPGCTPRADWQLTYEIQAGDALDNIAGRYGTTRWDLAEGNCLTDPNAIFIGQKLRVPGEAHPQPTIACVPWEVLTPMNYAAGIDGNGQLSFTWIGPRGARNLIRVYDANNEKVWEDVVDLRQNHTISLAEALPDEGTYTWQVFPLDLSFQQIACPESPRWTFHKTASGMR